jgi:hypothetical protein
LGGDLSISVEDSANPILDVSRDEDFTIGDLPCTFSAISDDLIGMLKLMRFLTKSHTDSEARGSGTADIDYRLKCLGIQHQLEKLHFETKGFALLLEEACIFAAHIYVDLILLQTPAERIITGKMNGALQGSLIHLRKARKPRENDDILLYKHCLNSHSMFSLMASGSVVPGAVAISYPFAPEGICSPKKFRNCWY